jgi:hypothetical protein
MEKNFQSGPANFELKLDGKPTKTFNNGYEMYTYAVQNRPKMEFEEKQRTDKTKKSKS